MADGILKVGQIQTSSGSGTITIGQSGETITIPSGATVSGAGTNTPAFFAYKTSSNQSISSGTITKVTFDTELYDTDGNYASDRFTPTTSGKYLFTTSIRCYANSGTLRYVNVYVRKNGSTNFGAYTPENNTDDNVNSGGVSTSVVYDMNGSSDYVEIYAQCHGTSPNVSYDNNGFTTYFQGFKLIGV